MGLYKSTRCVRNWRYALKKPELEARLVERWERWSRLNFGKHTRKTDRLQMTHKSDVGYESCKARCW